MADKKVSALSTAGAIVGATDFLYLSQAGVDKKLPFSAIGIEDFNDTDKGNWTPIDVSGAGLTISKGTCKFVKIGTLVYVGMTITYPSTADGSEAQLGGLPFPVDALSSFCIGFSGGISSIQSQIHSSEYIQFIKSANNAGSRYSNSEMSEVEIRGFGFYTTS